ncbi:MAG: putative dehydrogenase [Rhodothermales bacterium]|jgi:predicted dehydrogenase
MPTQPTRRAFMHASAAFSFSILAENTVSANSRINVGLIGLGKRMKGLCGSLTGRDDVRVLAVADVESERRKVYKGLVDSAYDAKDEGCATYGDYREVLARPDIDAVVVATPDHWHALITIDAFRAGKDVYCEKPLTHTLDEAIKVEAAATRYDRILQTGSQQRSDGIFRFAAEMVHNGRIGEIKEVYCAIGGAPRACNLPSHPAPAGMDWDFWLGPAPRHGWNEGIAPPDPIKGGWAQWRAFREYGGGGQCDFGAHAYDIAQWAMDMDGSGPVEVIAPQEREDGQLAYRYANGATLIRGRKINRAQVSFIGSEGTIGVNRGSLLAAEPETIRLTPTKPSEDTLYRSTDHMGDFLQAIRTRRQPLCNVKVGVSTAITCHLGNVAERIGHGFKWDPVTRTTDDAEARQYFGTVYRGGWAI